MGNGLVIFEVGSSCLVSTLSGSEQVTPELVPFIREMNSMGVNVVFVSRGKSSYDPDSLLTSKALRRKAKDRKKNPDSAENAPHIYKTFRGTLLENAGLQCIYFREYADFESRIPGFAESNGNVVFVTNTSLGRAAAASFGIGTMFVRFDISSDQKEQLDKYADSVGAITGERTLRGLVDSIIRTLGLAEDLDVSDAIEARALRSFPNPVQRVKA